MNIQILNVFLLICFVLGCQRDMDLTSPSSNVIPSETKVTGQTINSTTKTENVISLLAEDSELWTTPDSVFTWAAPDSNMEIVNVRHLLKLEMPAGGIVCLKQLKTDQSDPEIVYFKIEHYRTDISKNEIRIGQIVKTEFIEWDSSRQQKRKTNLEAIAHDLLTRNPKTNAFTQQMQILSTTACPDWSGSPQNLWAGAYYEHADFGGKVWTPWINHSTWDLGSYYVWLHLSYYDFANIMSSCLGDFDLKTEVCDNDVYRRFVYTKKMWLYKGPAGTGGYSDLVWYMNSSSLPFSIFIANPVIDGWYDDFSETTNNMNDNVESVAVLMEAIQKSY